MLVTVERAALPLAQFQWAARLYQATTELQPCCRVQPASNAGHPPAGQAGTASGTLYLSSRVRVYHAVLDVPVMLNNPLPTASQLHTLCSKFSKAT